MENSYFTYKIVSIITLLVLPTMALEECLQEQLRLKAQLRLLEHQTKLQQIKIENLLQEKELQFMDRGDDMAVIDLVDKRTYADCGEIYNDGHKRSGFYQIKPLQSNSSYSAFCDMSEGGGWTVFQRRSDGTQNFYRNWTDYKQGFGDFTTVMGEYWLGNDNLHLLTLQDDYILRIDLWDFEGQRRYADYKSFRVGDEESAYQISCGEYSGTAGDSLTGGFNPEVQWWANHNGMKFSTWDRDNDNYEENCAVEDKGGWWYNRCHSTNLNGLYYKGPYTSNTDDGVIWYTWHGWWYSLKYVAMKIRSVNFEPNLV